MRNSWKLDTILIFTPDHGYAYSGVLLTTCKVKIREVLWSEDKEVQGIKDFTLVVLAQWRNKCQFGMCW